jgi:Arylsulfotransferase (ASST)
MRARSLLLAVLVLVLAGCGGKNADQGPTAPAQHFVTRADLQPPLVHVLTPAHAAAPGYIFVAPKKKATQAGPLILDDRGNVVWFHPLDTHGVTDFRVQRYRGKPVLTWWRGAATTHGIGTAGGYVIADESYRPIAFVTAKNHLTGDIHEFLLTPQNTSLFTVYHKLKYDLSPLGGPKDGELWEAVVQEVDVATGKLLFEWHSLPHVAPSESYEHVPDKIPYDYFHINSIEPDGPDKLLLSGRHVGAIYEIRKSDGAVLWRLGGKESDFTLGRGTHFSWQHDARRLPDGTISLFDNAAEHPGEAKESKALVLRLDETKHTATLVRSYTRPKPLLSTSQGNAQLLANGDLLVGWGANPYVTEFSPDGGVRFDLTFGNKDVDSYRAYRDAWVGRPTTRPRAVVRDGRVYVSWNGATEVVKWRIVGGATFPKTGFESSSPVTSKDVVVQALDADGRVLGSTR